MAKANAPQVPAKVASGKVSLDKHLELRTRAKELIKSFAKITWEFVETIYEIRESKAFLAWGYKTQKDYYEEELQFSEQTIKNMLWVYDCSRALGSGVVKEFKAIGFSKAEVLASVITDENADEVLGMAKKQSLRELSQSIAPFRTRTPKPRTPAPPAARTQAPPRSQEARDNRPPLDIIEPPITLAPQSSPNNMIVNFQDLMDRDMVSDALKVCDSKYPDLETADRKLGMIATVFNSIHGGDDQEDDPILRLIQIWEQTFDSQFIVVIDGEIQYGEEAFQELVAARGVPK